MQRLHMYVPDGVLELKWQVDTCPYHYLRNYLQLNTTCKWKFSFIQGCFVGNNLLLRVGHKSCYRWATEPEINELFGGSLFTMFYQCFIFCLFIFLNLIFYIPFYFYPTVPLVFVCLFCFIEFSNKFHNLIQLPVPLLESFSSVHLFLFWFVYFSYILKYITLYYYHYVLVCFLKTHFKNGVQLN